MWFIPVTSLMLVNEQINKKKNFCIFDSDLYDLTNKNNKNIVGLVNKKEIGVICSFDNHTNIMEIANYRILIITKKRNIYSLNQIILNAFFLDCIPIIISDTDVIHIYKPNYKNLVKVYNNFNPNNIRTYQDVFTKIQNYKKNYLKLYINNQMATIKLGLPIVIIKKTNAKLFGQFINNFILPNFRDNLIICYNTLNDNYENNDIKIINAFENNDIWIINTILTYTYNNYIYLFFDNKTYPKINYENISLTMMYFNYIQLQFNNEEKQRYPIIYKESDITLRQICYNPTHSLKPEIFETYDNINDLKYIFKGKNNIYFWKPGWEFTSGIWNISEMRKNIGFLNDLIDVEIGLYDYSLRCYNLGYKCLIYE